MAITASEATPGTIYRPTRDAEGVYYTVHPYSMATLIRRLQHRQQRLRGRNVYLLARALEHPDWPLFLWHTRGTDPFTGERFEIQGAVLLNPTTRLREVQSKPGYRR